ncbi:MAG: HipA domain-containing protein [Elusimicrobia bacterium]|nr:HipA domain-containing protein [Elusimicrobiota bacterium]
MPRTSRAPLQVAMEGRRVGRLRVLPLGGLGFVYDATWLSLPQAVPLSRTMPLREEEFKGIEVNHYFDNLLPENHATRQRLARSSQAESTSVFDLLRALGKDCVGAFQFLSATDAPSPVTAARGCPLSDAAIADCLRELDTYPLGVHENSEFRLSLAGVQDKTAILELNGKWHLPTGSTPTTHIVKPPMGRGLGGVDVSLSVENEWFCLHLLERLGLRVAPSDIRSFQNTKALVVKRFDRYWNGNVLHRNSVEDLCQAFGRSADQKYESDGGPGVIDVLDLLNESNERERDRRDFFRGQVLFWLLGAIDGHAKNFSLMWCPSGFELAPLYDVLSADPWAAAGQLKRKGMKLSMAAGKNRHYRIDEITGRHWRETADSARLPLRLVEETLDTVKKDLPTALDSLISENASLIPATVYEPIAQATKLRLRRL